MNLHQLMARVGGLSEPSKMPGYGWSISAYRCITGSKLATVAGSVCSICYARKKRYILPIQHAAMEKRYRIWKETDPTKWVDWWIELFQHPKFRDEPYCWFRWFDSGDIQHLGMLRQIDHIAWGARHIPFWLPTKESFLVSQYLAQHGYFAPNLTVRVSFPMLEEKPGKRKYPFPTSGVSRVKWTCPAYEQGGKCLDCRMCWGPEIKHVVYKAH